MPFEEHTVEDFLKYEIRELKKKRLLANLCIRAAREAKRDGDERADKALGYYRSEREQINKALQEKLYGDNSPPSVRVQMLPVVVDDGAKKLRKDGEMTQKEVRRMLKGLVEEGKIDRKDVPKLMAVLFQTGEKNG